MLQEDNTIDVVDILREYGDVKIWMLDEVLHQYPKTTAFILDDRRYAVDDLYGVMRHWNKIMR